MNQSCWAQLLSHRDQNVAVPWPRGLGQGMGLTKPPSRAGSPARELLEGQSSGHSVRELVTPVPRMASHPHGLEGWAGPQPQGGLLREN